MSTPPLNLKLGRPTFPFVHSLMSSCGFDCTHCYITLFFFYFCNTDLNICGVLQGSGEIWQWTINFYKSPMMINNITMKAPKVYWQTNNYKSLDTSVIHSQISSPFLEFFCDKFMDWNRILYCDFSSETIEQFKMSVCK